MSASRYAPDTLPRADAWSDDALCRRGGDPDDWFADPTDRSTRGYAIGVCRQCPVRQPCLAVALRREGDASARERHGIWGGLTPVQRYALRRWIRDEAAAVWS